MGFPLGDWIDAHSSARFNLGQSGMIGSLRSYDRSLRRLPEPDADRLRTSLARLVGVPGDAIFLTHGATEGNGLVLQYLAVAHRRRLGRTPRLKVGLPEYPPLSDAGRAAGMSVVREHQTADAGVLSAPRNPLGTAVGLAELGGFSHGTRSVLVDETFREFTDQPSAAGERVPGRWTTGTFTKVYGGDAVRVGFIAAPPEEVERFADYHPMVSDRVPPHSVACALALLRDRNAILSEARAILRSNEQALREGFPDLPELAAPVWFDRVPDGDRLARRAVRAGVLVCPGSYFGDRRGVRLGLTRRNFPAALAAYLAVRRSGA
jgi:histidinol-phosphate/aromatic aminotransferase/cobyric acid decarboxylase-like protein